ncbi:probable tubulin polyglutamylase TTLL9 isoform X2 [Periplaneta americana]
MPTSKKSKKKLKFRCDFSTTILDVLRDRGWWQVGEDDDNWDLFWCEVTQLKATLDNLRLNTHQRVPHFRNHYELTRKNLLARNLKRLKRLYIREGRLDDVELCDCMPLTYELPNEYLMFVEEYRKHPGATWIVKPALGSQGRGIFLFQRLKDLIDWRSSKETHASGSAPPAPGAGPLEGEQTQPDTYVVQRYIEKPYLLAGRKFDIRFYVLVTSFLPLKVWLAREGFARLSGYQFSLNTLSDNRIHVTNMAVQLRSMQKGSCPKDYKRSLRHLREFLTAQHGAEVVESLVQRIANIVLTSLHSVQQVIMQDRHCFELYGYDILLDADLRPWLLEVNASPSLSATDSEDYLLKYNLVADLLNILNLEGRLDGTERRVGGFDLLWNNGPVWKVFPGTTDCHEQPHPTVGSVNFSSPRLNVFLGCLNDRNAQLRLLQRAHNKQEMLRD